MQIGAPTTFVAEGLLMYLPEDAVISLFRDMVTASSGDLRAVFTYLPVDKKGRPMLGKGLWSSVSRVILKAAGESMFWGCNPDRLADFLTPFNLQIIDHPEATMEWFVTVESKA